MKKLLISAIPTLLRAPSRKPALRLSAQKPPISNPSVKRVFRFQLKFMLSLKLSLKHIRSSRQPRKRLRLPMRKFRTRSMSLLKGTQESYLPKTAKSGTATLPLSTLKALLTARLLTAEKQRNMNLPSVPAHSFPVLKSRLSATRAATNLT